MKLLDRGEFQIIDYLKGQGQTAPGLVKGIGDDCAVISVSPGEQLLTTTDLLVESVHFDRSWTDMSRLGRKAVSVNVSDLAAMGARPRFLFLSLAIPDNLSIEDLDQLLAGFLQAAEDYGAVLSGGDTCRSAGGLALSVTAQGSAPVSTWIPRDGAAAGDEIYVTGTLGDSALALQKLSNKSDPDPFLLGRHLDPTARVATGLALSSAKIPTAMIDISDGLLGDLQHILNGSDVGATVTLGQLPLSSAFREELETDGGLVDLALSGGEDYELLLTAPPGAEEVIGQIAEETGVPITRIGRINGASGEMKVLGPDGEITLPSTFGYKHFHGE